MGISDWVLTEPGAFGVMATLAPRASSPAHKAHVPVANRRLDQPHAGGLARPWLAREGPERRSTLMTFKSYDTQAAGTTPE